MRARRPMLLFAAALGLSVPAQTRAAALLAGTRIAIANRVPDDESRNRIVCLARDRSVPVPVAGSTGDPTCVGAGGGGGSIAFRSATSGQTATSALPCRNWLPAKGGAGYRYLDRHLTDGVCRVVEIRGGRLVRALCEGRGPTALDFDLTAGQAQAPLEVSLRLGSAGELYCMRFGGVVVKDGTDARTFLARAAPPPSVACSPSGAFLDGPARY